MINTNLLEVITPPSIYQYPSTIPSYNTIIILSNSTSINKYLTPYSNPTSNPIYSPSTETSLIQYSNPTP